MICAWKELLSILPSWLGAEVDRLGRDSLQELRLRINSPPELVLGERVKWLDRLLSREDLCFCVNTASRYSPWVAATAAYGYITAPGGHRIGLCGETVCKDGRVASVKNISSLCIRVARDYPGIAERLSEIKGSVLILGAPGWGKTTLLRDLIRTRSDIGEHVAVVDERCELFPGGFQRGKYTDVLTGCPKGQGVSMLLRTMGPDCIAVDEITEEKDAQALISAAWCGVKLLATAHASSCEDFVSRPVYSSLANCRIFDTIAVLHKDKTWHVERSKKWSTNGSVRY